MVLFYLYIANLLSWMSDGPSANDTSKKQKQKQKQKQNEINLMTIQLPWQKLFLMVYVSG